MEHKIMIECPHCSHQQEYFYEDELTDQTHLLLKSQLLNLDLFKTVCDQCQQIIPVLYETLYHDLESKVMILLTSEEMDEKKIETENSRLTKEYGDLAHYFKRIVNSPDELREKVMIHQLGLDDRIIEIVKLYYRSILLDQNPQIEIQHCLFIPSETTFELGFILQNERMIKTVIQPAVIDHLTKTYQSRLNDELGFCVIDMIWATQFVRKG